MNLLFRTSVASCLLLGFLGPVDAGHRIMVQGNNKLAVVNQDGKIEWEMKWGGIHDIHVLPSGNIMVQERNRKIVEIDPKTKKVVWTFDQFDQFGNSVPNSQILDAPGALR